MDNEQIKELRWKRFNQLLSEYAGKQTEFAVYTDISESFVSQMKRRMRSIPNETCRALEDQFGKPKFWFDTPDSDLKQNIPRNIESAFEGDEASHPIDYLALNGACGHGATIYNEGEAEATFKKGVIRKEASWFRNYKVRPQDVFAVYAKGDSNAEYICDGDMVIFDRTKTKPISGKIYQIRHPDGLKIKVLRQTLTCWIIESKNRDHPDEKVTADVLERLELLGQFVYRQGA